MKFLSRVMLAALVASGCTKGSSTSSTASSNSATQATPSAAIASASSSALAITPSAVPSSSASAPEVASAAPSIPIPPTPQDVAAFLGEVSAALKAKDTAFFDAHVKFPFTIQYYNYDMEGRIKPATFKSAAELIKKQNDWSMTRPFLAAVTKAPATVGAGDQDCNQTSEDKQIDYRKGAKAIQIKDADVTISFMASACSAEGHSEVYKLHVDPTAGFMFVKISATN